MKKYLLASILLISLFSGCSTVPLELKEVSDRAKLFNLPSDEKSGIYVYRDTFVGQALKKDIFIDNKCLGESSNKVFFYQDVKGNQEHTISTESEFSPNTLTINTKGGKNYFVRQYIKMGVLVGGADLEIVEDEEAKEAISDLPMAKKGTCGQ